MEALSIRDAPKSFGHVAVLHGVNLDIADIYVTHDQVEAMTLGDRIAVFDRGRIEQVGPLLSLYLFNRDGRALHAPAAEETPA
jgi:ABC-type proline/glycine betaine transport system ATPase subunit